VSAKTVVLAAAALVTAVAVGGGILLHSHDDSHDDPTPAARPATTLNDVDTTKLAVVRAPFCDRIEEADLEAALGGRVATTSSYGDGDSASLTRSVKDVAQEYSCTWTGAGASARAWVFAPPVTTAWARQLASRVPHGCAKRSGPAYGAPTLAYTCTARHRTTASFRGLFGDAWLSCDLSGRRGEPPADVVKRADRWCLVVADAAAS